MPSAPVQTAVLRLRGLRAANLRDLDLDLPLHRWTAITGPSGSGKSAILGQVLEPVARCRFRILQDPHALPGGEESWLARIADEVSGLPPVLFLSGELPRQRRPVLVGTALGLWSHLLRAWQSKGQHHCPACSHIWRPPELQEILAPASSWSDGVGCEILVAAGNEDRDELMRAGWSRFQIASERFRLEDGPEKLAPEAWLILDRFRWRADRQERMREALALGFGRGRKIELRLGDQVHSLPGEKECPTCGETTRSPMDLAWLQEPHSAGPWLLEGLSLQEWAEAPLSSWLELAQSKKDSSTARLRQLCRTGLGHLAATRALGTLSLGESRRLELSALFAQVRRQQLLWIDEPGLGLHGQERGHLCSILRDLVAQGNTVLTADPGRQFLESADGFVRLGPGGGRRGGTLVAQGNRENLEVHSDAVPDPRQIEFSGQISFAKTNYRYLELPSLELPLGGIVAFVGVSGSGKSTLLNEVLLPRLREKKSRGPGFHGVTSLLERALGWSTQSTVATLAGVWAELRQRVVDGEEGRIRGLSPRELLMRRQLGACPDCKGRGLDVDRLSCSSCEGLGLRPDLLELRQGGFSLRAWLQEPITTLLQRLPRDTRLRRTLVLLHDLGLGDRSLGERGRLLSLGERSRLALARSLASARPGRPRLFLLDEPCLGLPQEESLRVIQVLRKLSAEGHSFWVVEHEENFLFAADHLLELGPGAGKEGGRLLYSGKIEGLLQQETPTSLWLRTCGESLAISATSSDPPPLQSEILEESITGQGRQKMRHRLLREWSTRSPLAENLLQFGAEVEADSKPLAPVAWPLSAKTEASLLQVFGLEGVLLKALENHGEASCARCSGGGPWPDLAVAVAQLELTQHALGVRTWTAPLSAKKFSTEMLRAAGFRSIWRNEERILLRSDVRLLAGDEVFLDRGDGNAWEDATGRLLDMEHHARLLSEGRIFARNSGHLWEYKFNHCRDCGGHPESGAIPVQRWCGWTQEEWLQAPVAESLQRAMQELNSPLLRQAWGFLADTSLLKHPGNRRMGSLQPLESRLARLLGLLLFPIDGLLLLHDRPLAGFPAEIGMRLAQGFHDHGSHCWTDPENWAGKPDAASDLAEVSFLPQQGFALDGPGQAWADPHPSPPKISLRQALGLSDALRKQYLACEHALLRGWTERDLAPGRNGLDCSACGGLGHKSPHEALEISCQLCFGSGWHRETARLEIRGLRWPDLGRTRLRELQEHFQESPGLARALSMAVSVGLGDLFLDAPLSSLPLGLATLCPVLRQMAKAEELGLRWLHPFAGLTALEAGRAALRMNNFLLPGVHPVCKGHHPALYPSL